jgi:hypothetical protein
MVVAIHEHGTGQNRSQRPSNRCFARSHSAVKPDNQHVKRLRARRRSSRLPEHLLVDPTASGAVGRSRRHQAWMRRYTRIHANERRC